VTAYTVLIKLASLGQKQRVFSYVIQTCHSSLSQSGRRDTSYAASAEKTSTKIRAHSPTTACMVVRALALLIAYAFISQQVVVHYLRSVTTQLQCTRSIYGGHRILRRA
jgi:hypothetical protein